MLFTFIGFMDLLVGALLTGAMFGVWLSFNPAGMAPAAYVMQQQHGIRSLHPPMPILGALTILITLISAGLAMADRVRFAVLLAAAICYAIAGLITRFVNQPINSMVMTWSPEAPPANWSQYREKWWRWHSVRTAAGICGLCLLITAAIASASDEPQQARRVHVQPSDSTRRPMFDY